ncbi:MAG: serine/threonine protein kinase [Gammaproteobacteria bacterium]|nr:serine/threonine protein kinase [Gammaproteobacteria bacterium]
MDKELAQKRVGEVLNGKYRLERFIDIGGMGVIYQARNIAVNRTIVVKLLRDDLVSDDESVIRFLREAKAANVVRHRNIVEVFDIDKTQSGIPFIVQEYLVGESLEQLLERNKEGVSSKQVLNLLIPVIEAIGEAHARGVVHRDIKPSNIFLTVKNKELVAKVLDFGISKIAMSKNDIRVTTTDLMLGSPAYMSPEQIHNPRDVTPRSDVWSIGVLLYEMLSGRLLFDTEQASVMMVKICTEDPRPLRELAPATPIGLVRVVNCALSRPPQGRYADAAKMAQALREVRENELSTVSGGISPVTSSSGGLAHAENSSTDHPMPTLGMSPVDEEESDPDRLDWLPYVAAFLALLVIMFVTDVFAPEDFASSARVANLGTYVFLVVFIAAMIYLAIPVHNKAEDYSLIGLRIASTGLYGLGAAMLVLFGGLLLTSQAFLYIAALLMPVSAASVALGFSGTGFMLVRDSLFGFSPNNKPGIVMMVLASFAGIVGLVYVFKVISNISGS